MKAIPSLLLILMVVVFAGCGDDDAGSGSLKLNFKLKYGDQPLVMFEPYTYPTGQR